MPVFPSKPFSAASWTILVYVTLTISKPKAKDAPSPSGLFQDGKRADGRVLGTTGGTIPTGFDMELVLESCSIFS